MEGKRERGWYGHAGEMVEEKKARLVEISRVFLEA